MIIIRNLQFPDVGMFIPGVGNRKDSDVHSIAKIAHRL